MIRPRPLWIAAAIVMLIVASAAVSFDVSNPSLALLGRRLFVYGNQAKRITSVQGEASLQAGAEKITAEFSFLRELDGKMLRLSETFKSNDQNSFTTVVNDRYGFELVKKSRRSDSDWAVKTVDPRFMIGDIVLSYVDEPLLQSIQLDHSYAMRRLMRVRRLSYPMDVETPLSVFREQMPGDAAPAKQEIDPSKPYLVHVAMVDSIMVPWGRVSVAIDRTTSCLLSYEAVVLPRLYEVFSPNAVYLIKGDNEYDRKSQNFPIPTKKQVQMTSINLLDGSVREYQLQASAQVMLDETPGRDQFLLTAYGLPEPDFTLPDTLERGSGWMLAGTVLAIAAGGIALLFGVRAINRSIAARRMARLAQLSAASM